MPYKDPEVRRAKAREVTKKWNAENPDKVREYSRDYQARKRAAQKKYNELHPEIVKARKKAWFDENPGYLKSYYIKNRIKYLVKQAQRRASEQGVPFDLSYTDLSIPDNCPVLGIPIRLNSRGGFNPHSPSLDRLVPALGYVIGNVRVISNRANLLKRDATLEEMRLMLAYMERELG